MIHPFRFLPWLLRFVLVVSAIALAAPAAHAATLAGTVTDPDGRVVPNVRILVLSGAAVVATSETDERGRFEVRDLPAGAYSIDVALDGFRGEPMSVRLAQDEDRDVAVRLRLSAVTESVVVSAAQVDLARSRVAASVTVMTADDLRARQADTVADALGRVPGLTVQRSGGRGALTSLFPRGGESNYTLVVVDGVPLNSFGGDFDFAHLALAGVERIEIVRGPQSAVHGGGAIGAVVQVVSGHGGRPRLDGSIETGSFDTTRLAMSTRGERGAWGWGVAAGRLSTGGFTGEAPATGARVSNDDYRATNVALSGSWTGPRRAEVRSDVRIEENERGFPGPYGSNPAGVFAGIDTVSRGTNTTRTYALSGAFDLAGRLRPSARVSYADLDGEFTSPYGASISATRRLALRAQADVNAGPALGLSFGAEFLRERGESTFITGAAFDPIPVRRSVLGSFVEARYDHASRLFIAAGIRAERIHRDALEGNPSPYSPRPDFAADTRVATTPRVSASYFVQPAPARARGWTKLHASAAAGIRPPDAFEIAFTDNPSLAPERSRSLDAGVEQALAGGLVVLDATAFVNRYNDLIVAVGGSLIGASRFRTDNISNARARGLEIAAALRAPVGLEVTLAYTRLATEILAVDGLPGQAPPPFAPGDPLIRRPRHQVSLDLAMRRGRASGFLRVGGRGRMLDVEPTLGAFGGLFTADRYVVADAGAAWQVARNIEFFGRVTNLFDRRYEETLGYPALPRAGVIGVRVASRR